MRSFPEELNYCRELGLGVISLQHFRKHHLHCSDRAAPAHVSALLGYPVGHPDRRAEVFNKLFHLIVVVGDPEQVGGFRVLGENDGLAVLREDGGKAGVAEVVSEIEADMYIYVRYFGDGRSVFEVSFLRGLLHLLVLLVVAA